jgi:hypothetical protein
MSVNHDIFFPDRYMFVKERVNHVSNKMEIMLNSMFHAMTEF